MDVHFRYKTVFGMFRTISSNQAKMSEIPLLTFEAVISSEGHFFSQNSMAHFIPMSFEN
jgi:hypothetical protein